MAGTRSTFLFFNFNVINYVFITAAEVFVKLNGVFVLLFVKERYLVINANFVYIYIYICICVCVCNFLQYSYYWHQIVFICSRNMYVWKYKHQYILLPCLLQEYKLRSQESRLAASSKTCPSCHARYFLSVKSPTSFSRPCTNCKTVPVVLAWRQTVNCVLSPSEPQSGCVDRRQVSHE